MIIRIVRMEFDPGKVEEFITIFNISQGKIRSFEGCEHLELCQDIAQSNVYFTFSKWKSEAHLDSYRHSDFFRSTWSKTKALFIAKPLAYSLLTNSPTLNQDLLS